ncbi:ATP-binding protein [Deinococcus navajonensis]|uniref:ATP-binding protein n=1 Tax=Deinococcus navajonensis TaxID=309884 RepID=A0ABV8XRX5_9DEIO
MNLLERASPLGRLIEWSKEAAAGEGRLVLLAGEAGVGKTVFLREFARCVGQRQVLTGACDPLSTPRPLGPLQDVAGSVGGAFEQLLQTSTPRDLIFRAFLALLSSGRPFRTVVFEDVHWADDATLDLLRFLGRRLDRTRSLLIASYREEEVGPRHPLRAVLGDLATSPAARRLTLSSLSEAAVTHLARGGGLDPATLYLQTGGNPFYVTEVIAAGTEGVPATVRDAVLARAARLSVAAQSVLEAAAVIGARIELWLLQGVVPDCWPALQECVELGVLHAQGDSLTFRHELARQALLSSLSLPERLRLHQTVLRVLQQAPERAVDAARYAEHAEAAQDGPATIRYAVHAARQASELRAHREACAQYARALRHAGALPPTERAELLEVYADECLITDQPERAVTARQAALAIWQGTGERQREAVTLAQLSRLLVGMGRNAQAEAASQRSLDLLSVLPPGPGEAFAFWCQAHLRMLNRDNDEAVRWGRRAIDRAEQLQDRTLLVLALNTVGTATLLKEDESGRALLERSLELAREAGFDEHVALAYRMLSSVAGELYQFEMADRYLGLGLPFCTERDIDGHRFYMLAWQALSHLYQGRWAEAAQTALTVTARRELSATSRIMALLALGRVRARRGDPEAWDALDEALEMALQTGTLQRLAPVRAARAEAAWLAGNPDRTREEATTAYGLACEHQHRWFAGELAYWCAQAGAPPTVSVEVAAPYALQQAGRWQEAAAEWDRLHCPYEAARALAGSGQVPDLLQARQRFETVGAAPAALAVTRQLRQLGARGIPRGPRPTTLAHPTGLTARELQVLALLTSGLHDAEIGQALQISTKTAGHHVSAILAKLGVRSRVEAAREATRLNLTSGGEQPSPR